MLVSMPMAITVKAVLVANKREAQAEERSGIFLFWLQVCLSINVSWSRENKPNENGKGLNLL